MKIAVQVAYLNRKANGKPEGWLNDVLAKGQSLAATEKLPEMVEFPEQVARIVLGNEFVDAVLGRTKRYPTSSAPAPAEGPGTELKKLLAELNIKPRQNCRCNARVAEMNRRGVDWCRENVATIEGWLREEMVASGWKARLSATYNAVVTGIAFQLDALAPLRSLAEEAIARAERVSRGVTA